MYLFKYFDLFTDNMGVVYLRTKPNLTRREARWVEFLADYDFTCHHQCGKTNVADALSRRPDHDCLIAGHQGRDRTYLKLSRHVYWPGMSRSIQQFVKTCDRCQRVKGS